MVEQTLRDEDFLADPLRDVERRVLATFERGGPTCPKCEAIKPPIGRTGRDGLTEVAHLRCFPQVPDTFRHHFTAAPRGNVRDRGRLDFDPADLRPGSLEPLEPWHQPPVDDPSNYGNSALNVFCLQGVPAGEAVATIDAGWEAGEVDLRAVIGRAYGTAALRQGGKPASLLSSGGVKGSGSKPLRASVEPKLDGMARIDGVEIVFCSVRPPSQLWVWAPDALNLGRPE